MADSGRVALVRSSSPITMDASSPDQTYEATTLAPEPPSRPFLNDTTRPPVCLKQQAGGTAPAS